VTGTPSDERLPAVRAPEATGVARRNARAVMIDPSITAGAYGAGDADRLSFRQILVSLRRNRWLAVTVGLVPVALAILYSYKAPRVYESSATVRIDNKQSGGSLLKGIVPLPNYGSAKVLTEMEVLRSRLLAESVARSLNLVVNVTEPAGRRHVIQILSVPEKAPTGELTLTRAAGGRYDVTAAKAKFGERAPPTVAPGQPFSFGGARLAVSARGDTILPDRIVVRFRSMRDAAKSINSSVAVTRPNREAEIVRVGYRSTDPVLAAAVPNLLLDEFVRYKSRSNRSEASSTVEFLRGQVDTYVGQLKKAEAALGSYRQQQQVVSLGDEAAVQVKRMAELQAERDQLVAEQRSLSAILAKPAVPGQSRARDIAAFPSFITNRGMQDILAALIQVESERNALLVRRNPTNEDVVALTARIDDLNGQLTQMARGYLSGLDSKITALDANVATFGRQIESIPAKEIAFARLAREQKLLDEITTLLRTRLKEAEIEEAIEPGDVQVIDRALIPERPSSPRVPLNILLGLFVGAGLALFSGVARDMLNTRVRSREDAQSSTGGIPVLASIPHFGGGGFGLAAMRRADSRERRHIAPGAGLITLAEARSPSSEAYRALRTNITFAGADTGNRVIVFTSALPGDGKSTTASNLALTLAQQGARTLLIDADLRKGSLHTLFGVRREPGLTQLLVGTSSLTESLQLIPTGDSGIPLSVLTSGPYPPNPTELLGSEKMRKLVAELRQQFDMIIFDTPPLALVTDAAILGTLADTTIVVARAGVTEKRALQDAASQLYQLGIHVSGTILNDFNPLPSKYGYGYAYGQPGKVTG
jgi:tyrosine-protein kinase Etk/Wzc